MEEIATLTGVKPRKKQDTPEPPYTELADILAEDLDVIFCGINPALSAAKSGHHFSNGSNRFWRVLHQAGFTPHLIRAEDDRTILDHAYGLTAAVQRPTVSADEVNLAEFHASASSLREKVRLYRPRYLAFLGKPAFAALFQQKLIPWGRQQMLFEGAEVWVLPNPSGLNRAFTLDVLVSHYRELRVARDEARTVRGLPSKTPA